MTTAADTLAEAARIVTGERQEAYGPPERNFETIAALWSDYLGARVTAEDVCLMMCLLKIARARSGHGSADNFVDLAGYAALAAEVRP